MLRVLIALDRRAIGGARIRSAACREDETHTRRGPLDETTQVGAITTEAQNTTILDYIAKGKTEGAELVTGGTAIDLGRGQYIAPTLFSGVSREMAIARDEIFGRCFAR